MNRQVARVFSGIQPTGIPHLGNYFGAIAQWIRLIREPTFIQTPKLEVDQSKPPPPPPPVINTNSAENILPIFCIVDIHAYTSRRVSFGQAFYDNILSTTASLLALGLDPNKCILFRQSDILEHNYLDNVFDNFVSPNRLTRMTQFKEKTNKSSGRSNDSLLNGLLNYPVLQTADILLYKANLVPVGEDQIQHIELARDIARKFNVVTNSQLFPEPNALLQDCKQARRVKSLRDPSKKMSKSDSDLKSFIEVVDEPEIIIEKVKKAVTDSISAVYYDAVNRPGVSNLMQIHSLATGETFEQITEQSDGIETAQYKLRLADILVDKFKSTREAYKRVRSDHSYLENILKLGHDKAKPLAHETVSQVKHLLGSYRNSC